MSYYIYYISRELDEIDTWMFLLLGTNSKMD